ncbi:MAG TPA: phage holin family protein [Nitrospirales bacterium]|nr:phage holin family protein [Nitrospirales bacterium]
MRGLLVRFSITAIAVFLASQIVPGIEVRSVSAAIAGAIVLAFLNALLRPILYLFSMPLILLTLGLFMIVINALLLHVVAWLVKGFEVTGFWPSFWGALLISVVSSILNLWVSERGRWEMVIAKPGRPPKILNP